MQKVSTDEWVEFKIIDLFTVINTHSILKSSIDEGSGNIPYVTASNTNNGVYAYISFDEAYIEKGNAIMIGGKTLTVTYQSQDFVSNDSHNLVLYLKDETKRTKNIQLFLVSVIATCLGKIYSWGDSISYKSIQKDVIYLPVDEAGNPNFSYMETYMKNLGVAVSASLNALQSAKKSENYGMIDTREWKVFHLYDIFKIDSGTKLDKAKMDTTVGEICFVGRSNINNGITQRVRRIKNIEPYEPGNMTLSLGGAYLGSCFIQNEPFYTSQNVVVLMPLDNISFSAKMFISVAIFKESQNNYRAFIKELNAHIKRDFQIKLPAKQNGEPDYEYMENYIEKRNKVIKTNFGTFSTAVN